jgi:hypothetical protein
MIRLILGGFVVAQAPELAVVWEAPWGCPDADALRRAIALRLARPPGDGEIEVAGQVVRHAAAPRYRLTLRLRVGGDSQVRTLAAERCASLVDASALLVALAVADAEREAALVPVAVDAVEEVESSEGGVPVEVPVEVPGPRAAIVAAAVDEPEVVAPLVATRSRGPGGVVRLSGGPEYGAVPGVTGAVGLAVGVLWRRARLELQGLYLAPRTARRFDSSARVSVLAGSVHGCYRAGRGAWELPLCGGVELGGQRARVEGPGARPATGLWAAALVTAGVAWHVHARVSVALALQGAAHLTLPQYELGAAEQAQTLFRPQPVSGRLLVGLEWRPGDGW